MFEVAYELNPNKAKSMAISRSRIYALGYGDLTLLAMLSLGR